MTPSTQLSCVKLEREEPFEGGDVAIAGRSNEGVEKTAVLNRSCERSSALRDMLPSSSDHLPRVGLRKPEGTRDITV